MKRHLAFVLVCCVFIASLTGCASRLPMIDDRGEPLPPHEVAAQKSTRNFALYTIGGGALSFGISFFIGSLVDRSLDSENNQALWISTAAGTALGLLYFAGQGRVRDHNLAVEAARANADPKLQQRLAEERRRRESLELEKQRLIEERKRQEDERRRLLEQLKARENQKQKN